MSGNTRLVILIWLTVLQQNVAVFLNNDLPADDLYKAGDLVLGGLFSLYNTDPDAICGTKVWRTMVRSAQAMIFMIDEVNKDPKLLPNVTLGYAILNDCNRQNVALARATKFVPVTQCVRQGCHGTAARHFYDVIGVIASYSSKFAVLCSSLLGVSEVPELGWSATSDELSDKTRYPYFSRLVPPDLYQAKTVVDIMKYFNWTYISTLHSEGSYGANGIRNVIRFARKEGICIAYSSELTPDESEADYDKVVGELRKNYKAKVIVLFLLSFNVDGLFKALERAGVIGEFVFIGSDGFAMDDLKGVKHLTLNTLYVDIITKKSEAFERYYSSLHPWNNGTGSPWFGHALPEDVGCSWDIQKGAPNSCHNYQNITEFPAYPFTESPTTVMDVVKTFAVALHELVQDRCPEGFVDKTLLNTCVSGRLYLSYIRKARFTGVSGDIELDEKGDMIGGYKINHVRETVAGNNDFEITYLGTWSRKESRLLIDDSNLQWFTRINRTTLPYSSIPESVCAKPCAPGEFYVQGELVCCWECRRCRDNERVRDDARGCLTCPENTWPEQTNFTLCEPIPPTYMTWLDPIGLSLVILAAVGVIATFIIIYIFLKYKDKKVIKGSNRELMTFIILGLLLAYVTVFAFITKAETWSCYVNYLGFNLSCTLIFGPLFVKTNRLFRIFSASENLKQNIRLVNTTSQVVFIFIIIFIEVGLSIVAAAISPPRALMKMPVITEQYVELLCELPLTNLLIPLSYNLFLLILCAVFGFLSRKLPDNFNESWYIFISVMTTLFVWIAFLPTYFVAFYAYHKAALLALALILNGAVTSLCLFAPKIYAVYYVDDKNIKTTNFEASTFDTSTEDASKERI